MKPRELYSGAAPAAMGQMGAGLMEAGANIGRSLQSGYESMGKGLAQGITAAAGAYADYKKMSSQVKADSAAFDALKDYMPKDVAESFDMQRRAMETDPSTSLQDRASFYNSAKSFLGTSIQHKMDMEKYQEQAKGFRQMPFYNMGAGVLGAQMQDGARANKAVGGVSGGVPMEAQAEDVGVPQGYGGYSTPTSSDVIYPYGTSTSGPLRANPKKKSYEQYYGLPNSAENTNVDFGMPLFPIR
tara:strand:+ start:1255 stop:1983 length:729 start_codon:yes stop_codon:yes gene_type:complete